MNKLDKIHDNAERTAALPERDMLLARLVLNGHLTTATGSASPQMQTRPNEKEKVDASIVA